MKLSVNKFKTKILCAIPALLLTLSAQVQAQCIFNYSNNGNGTCTITGYSVGRNGPCDIINIPSTLEGLLATSIADYAFAGSVYIGSVTIPSGVTSIGYGAFEGCTSLKNVTINSASANTTIGDYAFAECSSLTSIVIPNSVSVIRPSAFYECGLTSVTIGSGVQDIGTEAFGYCPSLASVYFTGNAPFVDVQVFDHDNATAYYSPCATGWYTPFDGLDAVAATAPALFNFTSSGGAVTITGYTGSCGVVIIPASINGQPVASIGSGAFYDIPSLPSVTIPASVTSIGSGAFAYCTGLHSFTIPRNVSSIGTAPFEGCQSLGAILVASGNTSFSSVGGVLFNSSRTMLLEYPGGASQGGYMIPGSVNSIADEAFFDCTDLTGVTIPSGVQAIGGDTFGYCTSLSSVSMPESLVSIGGSAFAGCSSLPGVTIPGNVTNIEEAAFEGCSSLVSVYFEENSPPIVDSSAFTMSAGGFPGGFLNATAYYSPCGTGWYTPFAGLNAVAGTAPALFNFTSSGGAIAITGYTGSCGNVTIPARINGLPVTSIEAGAFQGNTSLTQVKIPDTVTSVGDYAFYGCTGLTSLTLGNNVQSIGDYAFDNTGLADVWIPASVTSIGCYAFYGLSLQSAHFEGLVLPSVCSTTFQPDPPTIYALPGATGLSGFTATTDLPVVPWHPMIQGGGTKGSPMNNQFGFTISWADGQAIVVQACTNLASRVWISLSTNSITNGSFYFSDPDWTNHSSRFYRVGGLAATNTPAGMALIPAGLRQQ